MREEYYRSRGYERAERTPFPHPPRRERRLFPTSLRGDEVLIDLNGYWLHCECRHCRTVQLPINLMCARIGWDVSLASVLKRLKCTRCGKAPSSVRLVDDPSAGAHGIPKGKPQQSIFLQTRSDEG